MNLNCFELFYATYVNTAECSYTFISLFTSLSLCCLHLVLAVFMEKLASLVSRCFKITLSVSPLSNKNAALIRLFTMKNKTFFQFASLAVCTLLFPSCYTYVYLVFSAWACLVGLYQGFHLRPEAGRFVRSFAIPRPVLWDQYWRFFFTTVLYIFLTKASHEHTD